MLEDGALPLLEYIVDVGAYNGVWSESVLRLCEPKRLIAIEPNPTLQEDLRARIGDYESVTIVNAAAGANRDAANLNVTRDARLGSLLTPRADEGEQWEVVDQVTVDVCPLDELVTELPEVSILKIDVQGYERHVLEGAQRALERTRRVMIEVLFESSYEGDMLFAELDKLMREHGFALGALSEPVRWKGRAWWSDALYLRI